MYLTHNIHKLKFTQMTAGNQFSEFECQEVSPLIHEKQVMIGH